MIKKILRKIALLGIRLGFDIRVLSSYRFLPRYFKERREWLNKGGKITHSHPILDDYGDSAGSASGHYFHQDLLVARYIYLDNPERHIDVGSRIDGFVAHVAAFREIEIFDVRPLSPSIHSNIVFSQSDLMTLPDENITDSLSCLHTIEHFGLGRYTDPIDLNGHIKGIKNLIKMLKKDGVLYISFPIGSENEVHFNAHRVFHPQFLLNLDYVNEMMQLQNFDYIDDAGDLHLSVDVNSIIGKVKFGCGIYTLKKLV